MVIVRPGARPARWALAAAATLLALGAAAPARAQVFLASEPHPPFAIGPVFILASVTPDLGPVAVRVSWGLRMPPRVGPGDVRQTLYLFWPAEIADGTPNGPPRADLRRFVEERGFAMSTGGRLMLRKRGRAQLGTSDEGESLPETAAFVTFYRRGTNPAQSGLGTFIEIPWSETLVDPAALMSLSFRVKELITPRPATWLEELFWGRRHVLAIGAASPGSVGLYSMFLEQRDRVVPFARDFSLILANFADAERLRVEEISPPAATRRPSRVRAGSETITLPLASGEGSVAQVLKVQFTYHAGRIAWRPILISLLFLVLGNLMGAFMFTQEVARFFRRRLQLGHGDGSRRERGRRRPAVGPETIERIVPGSTTRAEVLAWCGPPDEEHESASTTECTLIYRVLRRRPQRKFSVGPLATVSHWVEERREVEIACDGELVSDVQTRVRRARV